MPTKHIAITYDLLDELRDAGALDKDYKAEKRGFWRSILARGVRAYLDEPKFRTRLKRAEKRISDNSAQIRKNSEKIFMMRGRQADIEQAEQETEQ